MTDKEFEKEERRTQDELLRWVVERDREKRVLLKRRARSVLGKDVFESTIVLYGMSHSLVETCLESVETINNLRRIRFELWCLKRGYICQERR